MDKLREVFATKDDLDQLKKVFATKDDLQKLKKEFEQNMFTNTTSLMVEMTQLKTELRNEFLPIFADIMGELKAIREDNAAATFRRIEMADTIENHETRITTIEKKLPRTKKITT